jgi:hypothetical protein
LTGGLTLLAIQAPNALGTSGIITGLVFVPQN